MPIHKIKSKYLIKAIESVRNQIYDKWELCAVVDGINGKKIDTILENYKTIDNRIKYVSLEKHRGISAASNYAVSISNGEYLSMLDHDDELEINALYEVVKTINNHNPCVIYSDEALIDKSGKIVKYHFKPDFSPDLLLSHNYITHFLTLKKDIFHMVGGFRSKYDGAQDYDLLLRTTEITDKVYHIPIVLYRWRMTAKSSSAKPSNKKYTTEVGHSVLESSIKRRKLNACVYNSNTPNFYSLRYKIVTNPKISIIIPFKDKYEYTQRCILSILNKSTYHNYEIICINNDSVDEATNVVIEKLKKLCPNLKLLYYNGPFNYSRINNLGVSYSNGEHIVLMNNDVEIITSSWIEALLEHSQRREIGAVGAKLLYPNNTIQHAGVIIGIGGFAGHSHKKFHHRSTGYMNRIICVQNFSAVTGALMMVKKNLYELVGGLDENSFKIALNDIDFCLKLRERSYLNVYTPHCEAYHYESVSRGPDNAKEKNIRFEKEKRLFQNKWSHILEKGDPFYNRNLTLNKEDFSLKTEKICID
jgi:GT2 family glycosyltransferase